jgi:tetratricopeptide (TPR) repeat protein
MHTSLSSTPAASGLALLVTLGALTLGPSPAQAQFQTMGSNCREPIEAAEQMNAMGQHSEALAAFDAIVEDCTTRDSRERIQAGRARAFNGMGRYDDAIAAADATIEAYDKNLDGFFERAYAHEQMGDLAAAEADYNRVIELTENNQNVAERATLYAYMADRYHKAGKTVEAEQYMTTALELDPANPDFHVIQGDWAAREGDYDGAFQHYDRAGELGRDPMEMHRIRSTASLRMVQEKYGTEKAQELRQQMTPEETEFVCSELTRALEAGMQDMQMDLFAALVCR